MRTYCLFFILAISLPSICSANEVETITSQIGESGPAGSEIVTRTTTVPIYQGNGYSVGGYSSTTVSGGASTDGSGNITPNTTRGSTSNTTNGFEVTIPLPARK